MEISKLNRRVYVDAIIAGVLYTYQILTIDTGLFLAVDQKTNHIGKGATEDKAILRAWEIRVREE